MAEDFNTISIIGSGNVATHLAQAFCDQDINVSHILSRNEITGKLLAQKVQADFTADITSLPKNQLTIVCVPDDQIQQVINDIPPGIPVAYSSGSVELQNITTQNELGVFYPLQTFSKDNDVNMFNVPILIEASDETFSSYLFDLAWKISRKVEYANSEKRRELHLAAVWINNFVNHCIYQSKAICDEFELDASLLHPLLEETVRKALNNDPKDIQTGPARRGDISTIEKHLSMQTGLRKDLYELMTLSIQNTYKK